MPRRKQANAPQSASAPVRHRKPVVFLGSSRRNLKKMSKAVLKEVGNELLTVQHSGKPSVPVEAIRRVGRHALELKVDHKDGWFRVIYVAAFPEAVYVLHAFEKKTNAISAADVEVARKQYSSIPKR